MSMRKYHNDDQRDREKYPSVAHRPRRPIAPSGNLFPVSITQFKETPLEILHGLVARYRMKSTTATAKIRLLGNIECCLVSFPFRFDFKK